MTSQHPEANDVVDNFVPMKSLEMPASCAKFQSATRAPIGRRCLRVCITILVGKRSAWTRGQRIWKGKTPGKTGVIDKRLRQDGMLVMNKFYRCPVFLLEPSKEWIIFLFGLFGDVLLSNEEPQLQSFSLDMEAPSSLMDWKSDGGGDGKEIGEGLFRS